MLILPAENIQPQLVAQLQREPPKRGRLKAKRFHADYEQVIALGSAK